MIEIKKTVDVVENRLVDESKVSEKDLVFYYSRARRLAKAPPQVRALYENQPPKRFNIFRSLVDSKPKAFLFTAIIIMCLVILFMTYLMPDSGKTDVMGNLVEVSAMRYSGSTFIVLKKSADVKKSFYTGLVDVIVYSDSSDLRETARKTTMQIVWTDLPQEEFRFSVPFENSQILVSLQIGADVANFTVNPE
ncbi:MAG: hypothetical protein LBC53_08075 [Spirochaetaceae bacterium]|jgi:hypothetical protein|nr:hypothetical protein [Spirochaetaceae bacterium]